MFRLHIDLPLGDNEEDAVKTSRYIVGLLQHCLKVDKQDNVCGDWGFKGDNTGLNGKFPENISVMQYRLAKDEDRRESNYLVKDDNGHVTRKKVSINL